MTFNDFEWHDAILKNIQVDRNNPGVNDCIALDVLWPDGKRNVVLFENVYLSKMRLGFGFLGDEFIYEAFVSPNDDIDLIEVLRCGNRGEKIKLNCYFLKTASFGSEIKIIAEGFRIVEKR
jgi:hypothetical protein